MMPPKVSAIALPALLGAAAAIYVIGLVAGMVSFVGYEARTERQAGATRTSTFPIEVGIPVWLRAGQAIRADFDVDARFGAVTLTVAPPLWLRTSLQSATAYVEGRRSDAVLFMVQAPGWYTFKAEPTSIGGPRCGPKSLDLKHIVIGDAQCPVYDVSYRVTWRLAAEQDFGRPLARLEIPRPNGTLVVLHIR
jgi:hypothetical protein